MLRASILDGNNKNYDRDYSKLLEAISNPGVISWLDIVAWKLQIWKAFVQVKRANTDSFYCFVENTAEVTIDVTWTKKVWLEVKQANIDDWTLNAVDWSGIVEVKTWASYPTLNFLKIASITAWTITDEREMMDNIQDVKEALETALATQEGRLDELDTRVDDIDASLQPPSGLVSEYIAWEDLIENDSTFLESLNWQDISDYTIDWDEQWPTIASYWDSAWNPKWWKIIILEDWVISKIIFWNAVYSWQSCYLKNNAWTILATSTISLIDWAYSCTFKWKCLKDEVYRIEANSSGNHDRTSSGSWSQPLTGLWITYTGWSSNGSDVTTLYAIKNIIFSRINYSWQNIGDVTANTKINIRQFWWNISNNKIKLILWVKWSPSVNLWFQVEWENNWTTNWIALQTGNIAPASLLTQVDLTTDNHSQWWYNTNANTWWGWCVVYAKYTELITTVNRASWSNAPYCQIWTTDWLILKTVPFVAWVATLNFVITAWKSYVIQWTNFSSSYTSAKTFSTVTFPLNKTNINFTNWWLNGSYSWYISDIQSIVTDWIMNRKEVTLWWNIIIPEWQICNLVLFQWVVWSPTVNASNYYKLGYSKHTTTRYEKLRNGSARWNTTNKFPLVLSSLFKNQLLSKTDADYSYKLDFKWFVIASKSAWQLTWIMTWWTKWWFVGKTIWASQYLSNTPWVIQESPWTNLVCIWNAGTINSVEIIKNISSYKTAPTSLLDQSILSQTVNTSAPRLSNVKWLAIFTANLVDNSTSYSPQYYIDYSLDWTNRTTMSWWVSSTPSLYSNHITTITIPIFKWVYYRTRLWWDNTIASTLVRSMFCEIF